MEKKVLCSLIPPQIQISGNIDYLVFNPFPEKKQTLSHFMFYVVLNIAFQRETKVHMESSFGYFFFKKQDFPILNKIQ